MTIDVQKKQDSNCVTFETEDIHYLEMFNSMRIESVIDNPYQNSFHPVANRTKSRTSSYEMKDIRKSIRNLQNQYPTPDAPVIACSDNKVWGDPTSYRYNSGATPVTVPDDYQYQYFLQLSGCMSYAKNVPGIQLLH